MIRAAHIQDIVDITHIYNAGIKSGLGTFETRLREEKEIQGWLDASVQFPILVAEHEGKCVGFARLFEYRARDCYAGIAEFSIYLDQQYQGLGIGTKLLKALIRSAEQSGKHKLISRIFTFNSASRALCKKSGFREVGVYQRHGKLNDQWLDVVIVEYLIAAN
ncbi:L-methionine sulfoximine/L-methionine sulfone acetyltransferase [Thalassocella blandensis]|nr:L-methionine sulfoximine/L-methionine sulfone acetyltransferase [Thalassocella blandensis]